MHFALNRVRRIVRFQQHSPNQTSFKSSPPPPPPSRDVSSLYITITRQNGLRRIFCFLAKWKRALNFAIEALSTGLYFSNVWTFWNTLIYWKRARCILTLFVISQQRIDRDTGWNLPKKLVLKQFVNCQYIHLVRCCYKTLIFLSFFFCLWFEFSLWVLNFRVCI